MTGAGQPARKTLRELHKSGWQDRRRTEALNAQTSERLKLLELRRFAREVDESQVRHCSALEDLRVHISSFIRHQLQLVPKLRKPQAFCRRRTARSRKQATKPPSPVLPVPASSNDIRTAFWSQSG